MRGAQFSQGLVQILVLGEFSDALPCETERFVRFGKVNRRCLFGLIGQDSHLVVDDFQEPAGDGEGGFLLPVKDAQFARAQSGDEWRVGGQDGDLSFRSGRDNFIRLS